MSSSSNTAPCAVCGKAADPAYLPFCSKRCADVDLSRWLSGRYVVPGDPAEDADGPPSTGEDDA